MPAPLTPEELKRQADEARAKAIAAFPFELIETRGEAAVATWEQLKRAGRGAPVVLGSERHVADIADHLRRNYPQTHPARRSVGEIVAAAARLRHPQDLIAQRAAHEAHAQAAAENFWANPPARLPQVTIVDAQGERQMTAEEMRAWMLYEPRSPPLGEWPAQTESVAGLSVVIESPSGRTREKVCVALIPTDDWTTIPAHLRWGGWNDCPHPEYHVAALRAWRERYGAELVGLGTDVMDLRVTRPPQSRADALDLAREHYVYCADIVDQGVGTLSALAALLLGNEWWSFWWD